MQINKYKSIINFAIKRELFAESSEAIKYMTHMIIS